MTLDEAIQHCEEVAKEQERLCKCNDDYNFSQPKWKKCAEEHRQLTEWLKELKQLKEQKPKSEWEHDHEILKAYSDGASAVLDKIRAEIDAARFLDKDKKLFKNANASGLEVAMDIIDKYKAEGSDKE